MRSLFYLMLMMLISCTGKIDKTDPDFFSNLQFSLDTVIIDPGDEILFLKHQLFNSDVGKDNKYLFNFNEHDYTVEKINLDELRLEEKLPFEKEGPNGIGAGMGIMKVLDRNQVSITGMYQSSLFSLDGEKLMTVYYENFSLAKWHTGGDLLKGDRVLLDPESKRLYGLIQGYDNGTFVFGILYLDQFEISRMKLKNFEKSPDYSFMYFHGKSISYQPHAVGIEKFGEKVILSNEITSTLMWYDTEMDTLLMKSFNSQLTANQKEKEYKKEHKTPEQFQVEYRRFKQEINFLPPFWDEKNQVFYRFSYQELPTSNVEDQAIKADVYLTALDKDLNQIGETKLPLLTRRPGKHFAKDGNIWIYENLNDEMGFVRLKMQKIK